MMPHQDWNRVTFAGPVGKPKKGERAAQEAQRKGQEVETIRRSAGVNAARPGPANMRRLAEATDVVPVAQLTHEFRSAMQKARSAAGLSQADLARRINEKQSVINDYESGRAVPNPNIIVKLDRALGVRLPRPPKPKKRNEDD